MCWKPGVVLRAFPDGPFADNGYVYRGLGLVTAQTTVKKGKPTWWLIHLGSGHALCRIVGKVAEAFPIATEIAECGEWDWDGLDGWKNRDPEIKDKAVAIMRNHSACVVRRNAGSNPDVARAVALARA